ncbi:MAG: hypothetical protein HY957_06545 [Nitrospirae bacterium]|nr:hypothetical protein [Nitrospirota bacterium]
MKSNVALLWDESFLWGIMAYRALKANKLSFEIISANDIKNGKLKNYEMLFVPGGWASNKSKALGDKGITQIKKFVNKGGNYLGFCGGAGLATLDGMGLLNIKRKPTKERVPSFSGRIHLNINDHPIWNSSLHHSITPSTVFHAWWPSQFIIADKNIKILATYGNALSDSFSSDLNVGDMEADGSWHKLEHLYQINLDPKRMLNDPAVVEGTFGKGRVMLSLVHFDTPEDADGARVLRNLWKFLVPNAECGLQNADNAPSYPPLKIRGGRGSYETREVESAVEELISLGIRNFLWFRRNPMLLQWRRGVRGLEYCTLHVMINELKKLCIKEEDLHVVKELLIPFVDKAKQLLILERLAMQDEHITYEKCGDTQTKKIRIELFGNLKSHGGLFKNLVDEIDAVLFRLIR